MARFSRALALVLILIFFPWSPGFVLSGDDEDPRSEPRGELLLPGQSQLLIELRTGQVLYEVDPDLSIPPASLAKIMALEIAFSQVEEGRLSLDDTVTIGINAWTQNVGGSSMFLEPGETLNLDQLIRGVTVASGNDAAVALAEHIAQTEDSFVASMNKRAQQLGMEDTLFVSASGLPTDGDDGSTTARDMARLAREYVLAFPEVLGEYHSQRILEWKEFRLRSYNGLLWEDRLPVNGLKTGFTSQAGYHIIATAEEGDMLLAAVVLGAGSESQREGTAARLLEYGFSEFQLARENWTRRVPDQVRVWQGREDQVDLQLRERDQQKPLVIPRGATVESRVELRGPVRAPVGDSETLGELILEVIAGPGEDDLEEIARLDIVAGGHVARGNLFRVFVDAVRLFFAERFGRI